MAITWQSIATPQFGSSNQLAVAGGNTITSGLDRLAQSAKGISNKQKETEQANYEHNLLDLSMNPDLNKNEFLSQALKLGKEQGLDPNQSLDAISKIASVRNEAESLDSDQQMELKARTQNLELLRSSLDSSIQEQLTNYDQDNLQVRSVAQDLNAFAAGGGLTEQLTNMYDSIEDTGDREETSDAVARVLNSKEFEGYEDYVVSKALGEVGLGEVGLIFDGSLINKEKFKKSLRRNAAKLQNYRDNVKYRKNLETTLLQERDKTLMGANNALYDWQVETKQNNLRSYSSK